jgi:L-2-hydroxyglutarate oxidase LhgO
VVTLQRSAARLADKATRLSPGAGGLSVPYNRCMESVDAVVIGAGVVGLAVARELANAGREVLILEAESHFGTQTSSRNSEVIHAGIYYPTGSLKARLCVQGREMLYRYCVERGVPHRQIGKVLVASTEDERTVLAKYAHQAAINGVMLEPLDSAGVRSLEPEVKAVSHRHYRQSWPDAGAAGRCAGARCDAGGADTGDRCSGD